MGSLWLSRTFVNIVYKVLYHDEYSKEFYCIQNYRMPSDTDDVQEEQYNDVPFEPKIEEVD